MEHFVHFEIQITFTIIGKEEKDICSFPSRRCPLNMMSNHVIHSTNTQDFSLETVVLVASRNDLIRLVFDDYLDSRKFCCHSWCTYPYTPYWLRNLNGHWFVFRNCERILCQHFHPSASLIPLSYLPSTKKKENERRWNRTFSFSEGRDLSAFFSLRLRSSHIELFYIDILPLVANMIYDSLLVKEMQTLLSSPILVTRKLDLFLSIVYENISYQM